MVTKSQSQSFLLMSCGLDRSQIERENQKALLRIEEESEGTPEERESRHCYARV
jgi:hypothetical protein